MATPLLLVLSRRNAHMAISFQTKKNYFFAVISIVITVFLNCFMNFADWCSNDERGFWNSENLASFANASILFCVFRKNKLARFITDFNNNSQKKKATLKGGVVNESPFLLGNGRSLWKGKNIRWGLGEKERTGNQRSEVSFPPLWKWPKTDKKERGGEREKERERERERETTTTREIAIELR